MVSDRIICIFIFIRIFRYEFFQQFFSSYIFHGYAYYLRCQTTAYVWQLSTNKRFLNIDACFDALININISSWKILFINIQIIWNRLPRIYFLPCRRGVSFHIGLSGSLSGCDCWLYDSIHDCVWLVCHRWCRFDRLYCGANIGGQLF